MTPDEREKLKTFTRTGLRSPQALLRAQALLLADEPSGNLDAKTGEEVMNLLFKQAEDRKMTLILVTHDEALSLRCHRRVVLTDGRAVEAH